MVMPKVQDEKKHLKEEARGCFQRLVNTLRGDHTYSMEAFWAVGKLPEKMAQQKVVELGLRHGPTNRTGQIVTVTHRI
jgi:hypothetical protein